MPWTVADVDKHKKGLKGKKKRQWVHVANRVLSDTGDEGRAIREANSVTGKTSLYEDS